LAQSALQADPQLCIFAVGLLITRWRNLLSSLILSVAGCLLIICAAT
jgi:hypothetical protein